MPRGRPVCVFRREGLGKIGVDSLRQHVAPARRASTSRQHIAPAGLDAVGVAPAVEVVQAVVLSLPHMRRRAVPRIAPRIRTIFARSGFCST
ncbi:MAG: hypothetical protein KF886_03740 [Candidatus Hydrogenedentes bacterium]|nr:hypothetical protein [Candidatus Hydrogenedentota bacterium]